LKKLLKGYVLRTYGMFYCFLLVIGMTMLVLKAQTLAEILKVISAWTATFVLIAMFRKIYPKDNLVHYIKRQFSERIKVSTVLCIILLQFLIFLGSLLFTSTVQNVPIKAQVTTSWITLLIIFGNNLIRGPLGEELGWRGFVLNELQKKYSPIKSAIIIGVVWGFWHTPLWFITSELSGIELFQYIICFLVTGIAASIIITAFYSLNHNLLIPIIIHQLLNFLMGIQIGNILHIFTVTASLYLLVAVVLVLINFKKCLYGNAQNTKNEHTQYL
jgi:uncharacterized protein